MFNENLLREIHRVRETIEIVGSTDRLSGQLEVLRYVRNRTLGISYDQGVLEENDWILNNPEWRTYKSREE